MPGVSAEECQALSLDSFMPGASFFSESNGYPNAIISNGDFVNGVEFQGPELLFDQSTPGAEGFNFSNNDARCFLSKSLSFGSSPSSYRSDDFHHDSFAGSWSEAVKDDAFVSVPMSSGTHVGAMVGSSLAAFHKYLPSNNEDEASWPAVDAYSCDEFRMYEFKVRRCMRGRSHDWTECPFAHPGEKARRRDPRRFHYSGTACPDFRKGSCRRGDACEFAHGVFECWLHPARYRTQPCKDGRNCRRRVCFFAHTPEQLRLLPGASVGSRNGFQSKTHEGSNLRHAVSFDGALSVAGYDGGGSSPVNPFGNGGGYFDGPQTGGSSPRGYLCSKSNLSCTSQFQISSPTSTLVGHAHSPPPLSPPLSPSGSPRDSSANWTYGVSNSSPVGAANKPLHHKSFNFVNMDTSSVSASPVVHPSYSLQSPRRHNSISIPPSHDSRGLSSPVSSLSNDGSSQSPSNGVSDLISSLQSLDLNGAGSSSATAPSGPSQWLQSHASYAAMHSNCSPRASNLRHCSYSLPSTPTKSRWEKNWDSEFFAEEEPLQRVESGRELRAKIYGRLSRENNDNTNGESPDLGWVNELIK